MAMLKRQVASTPPPQWVRVVGGFTEHQFAEKRLPTLDEINAAAPETPVFILHLYDRALLNAAALRAVGYTKDTPNPPGGEIVRDAAGNPTGLLLAQPNATILYATLAKGPKLPPEYQLNSTRHFMRETEPARRHQRDRRRRRLPELSRRLRDHREAARRRRADRCASPTTCSPRSPAEELADFARWAEHGEAGPGRRHAIAINGAGEMLVYLRRRLRGLPRSRGPTCRRAMEGDLEPVVRLLAENRWPWRLHATYDETIGRALDVFEKVNRDIPLRRAALVLRPCRDDHRPQHRPDRGARRRHRRPAPHGLSRANTSSSATAPRRPRRTPPIARMLAAGVPVGAGTDATRVASYNPWVSLSWLVTGKTVGGTAPLSARQPARPRDRRCGCGPRRTPGSPARRARRGRSRRASSPISPCSSDDYFSGAGGRDRRTSRRVLTVLGGKVVHGDGDFADLAPALPAADARLVAGRTFGGYQHQRAGSVPAVRRRPAAAPAPAPCTATTMRRRSGRAAGRRRTSAFWGALGCGCWAF